MQALLTNIRASRQAGFTIIEIVVIVTVMAILTPVVMTTFASFYTSTITSFSQSTQDTDTISALRMMERELANNAGFLASVEVETPLGMDSTGTDWSYQGGGVDKRVLISRTYATTEGLNNQNRLPIFMRPTGDTCGFVQTEPAVVTHVYFVGKDPNSPAAPNEKFNLYRRTILPSTDPADYCGGTPYLKQSCAIGVTNSRCGTTDALLARDVSSLKVDYYASASASTPSVTSDDTVDRSALVNAARLAKITLETKRRVEGNNKLSTATSRIEGGVLVSMTAGGSAPGTDPNTDPSGGSATLRYFDTNGTFTIPSGANYIDIVMIGGGGGGQGGGGLNSGGHGGSSGNWSYTTLQRDVDIDRDVTRLSVSIGNGGQGGDGYASGWNYTLLGAQIGTQGGTTSVSAVIPDDPSGLGPKPLKVEWSGMSATGGAGGRGFPNNNLTSGKRAVPFDIFYLGRQYTAGIPGTSRTDGAPSTQPGVSPGGAGAGGQGCFLNCGRGANGASGGVWIRTY